MKLRPAVATAAALGLAAIPLLSFRVDAGPVAESTVAVMANDSYVDVGQEVANLIDDLEAGGHTTVSFDDVSAAGFTTALDGAEVLAIPELENSVDRKASAAGVFADALTAEAKAVIASFVDGGGRILFFGSSDPTSDMNDLFGYSLIGVEQFCDVEDLPPTAAGNGAETAAVGDDCALTADAASTEFADGPATLGYVNDSTALDPASLPAGSTAIYSGEIDDTPQQQSAGAAAIVPIDGVVSMPFGDGAVIFLGWDWYPDTESGAGSASVEDEANWAQVLDWAVSQPEVTAATNDAGDIVVTSDSPSTQPVFVALTINGTTQTVTIAPKTTSTIVDPGVTTSTTASFTVPGWGIGEGSFAVAVAVITAPGPTPVVANPSFTG